MKIAILLLAAVTLVRGGALLDEEVYLRLQSKQDQLPREEKLRYGPGEGVLLDEKVVYENAPENLIKRENVALAKAAAELGPRPRQVEKVDPNAILYTLSTKEGKTYDLQQEVPPSEVMKRPFNMYIHDYLENGVNDASDMILAYQRGVDGNLVIVNWGKYSYDEINNTVNMIVPEVGKNVGEMVLKLIKNGANIENFRMVGFGFGAHIAGIAGKDVQTHVDGKVRRITGLDPFGSGFNLLNESRRLDSNDGQFVDTIYTSNHYPVMKVISQASFYPNGGANQPFCHGDYTCEHKLARDLWANSVRYEGGFHGYRCNSYVDFLTGKCKCNEMSIMGYYTPDKPNRKPQGHYYLQMKRGSRRNHIYNTY